MLSFLFATWKMEDVFEKEVWKRVFFQTGFFSLKSCSRLQFLPFRLVPRWRTFQRWWDESRLIPWDQNALPSDSSFPLSPASLLQREVRCSGIRRCVRCLSCCKRLWPRRFLSCQTVATATGRRVCRIFWRVSRDIFSPRVRNSFHTNLKRIGLLETKKDDAFKVYCKVWECRCSGECICACLTQIADPSLKSWPTRSRSWPISLVPFRWLRRKRFPKHKCWLHWCENCHPPWFSSCRKRTPCWIRLIVLHVQLLAHLLSNSTPIFSNPKASVLPSNSTAKTMVLYSSTKPFPLLVKTPSTRYWKQPIVRVKLVF